MTDYSSERPHHRTTTSELFVCFPSRLSHSSMKISSKSILSPAHARDPPSSAASATLSASLSRRLKTNRSLRGGQSPMFPSGGKKRGCAFENPEPSSPKVTCIGQVRVKTRKKQGKNLRTFSKRRGGEVSFRRVDHIQSTHVQQQQQECLGHKNQSWVHLPLTICETLRSVGAEFSCLFPCRPSCFSTEEREKEEKSNERSGQSSCGAVFARWFVALQDGEEEGKRREIELVVGGEEEKSFRGMREGGLRRHVMEEIEMEVKEEKFDDEEGRVSICVPPKNALLLMRCRSDPMRMSALANRLVECPVPTGEEDEDDEHEDEHEIVEKGKLLKLDDSRLIEESEIEVSEKLDLTVTEEEEEEAVNPQPEAEHNAAMEVKETEAKENQVVEELDVSGEIAEIEEEEFEEDQEAGGKELNGFSTGDVEKAEDLVNEAALLIPEQLEEEEEEEEEERRISHYSSSSVISLHLDVAERGMEAEVLAEEPTLEESEKQKTEEEVDEDEEEEEEEDSSESEQIQKGEAVIESEKRETSEPVLPDCLLLMRCEPKLSMEVSKETWVCSTDFVRWLPRRQPKVKKIDGDDEPKKRISMDSNPAQQPPRSSCSLPAQAPAPASMATMIEQRLMSAVAYEPFVLTRCKSEPMRTAAAKLVPETCFWKNRKLETHRSATFGFGAAGVGF